MARIELTTAGHSVVIDDDTTNLDAIATKALELWWATRDPRIDRGFGVAGLTVEQGGLFLPFGVEVGRR